MGDERLDSPHASLASPLFVCVRGSCLGAHHHRVFANTKLWRIWRLDVQSLGMQEQERTKPHGESAWQVDTGGNGIMHRKGRVLKFDHQIAPERTEKCYFSAPRAELTLTEPRALRGMRKPALPHCGNGDPMEAGVGKVLTAHSRC